MAKGRATDYPAWVAAISGQLGSEFDDGFELLEPGQIFEKKPKEPKEPKEPKDKSL